MKINWGVVIFFLILLLIGTVGYTFFLIILAKKMTVTSWWRTPWHNAAVGGKPNSFHQIGLAWDVIPNTEENRLFLSNLGLRVIDEGDHAHAQIL